VGKRAQPTDDAAMNAKRELAKRLLDKGVAPAAVMRELGMSKSWIYRVRAEAQPGASTWTGIERRSGERRSGRDRRLAPERQIQLGMPGERRSGKDRRKHPLYANGSPEASSETRPR
jgi:hypothetical protein